MDRLANGGPMADEILETPAALLHLAEVTPPRLEDALAPFAVSAPRRVVYSGCGDMAFAAETTAALSALGGGGARAERAMDMRWAASRLGPGDLVVVASVSGRTPRSVEAAILARRAGAHVVAISASPDARLANEADALLPLELCPPGDLERHEYAGYQNAIGQTKSYAAVLFVQALIEKRLVVLGDGDASVWAELEGVPDELGAALGALREQVGDAVDGLPAIDEYVVLGSGPWRATAAYGGAKFLELAIRSRAQCIEEFHHLDMFIADERSCLVFLALDAASAGRVDEVVEPLAALGVHRIVLRGAELAADSGGCASIAIGGSTRISRLFQATAAAQLLALLAGQRAGRDVGRWLGGVRTDLMTSLGARTIRASRIEGEDLSRPGSSPSGGA